jgi:hypothetical protein
MELVQSEGAWMPKDDIVKDNRNINSRPLSRPTSLQQFNNWYGILQLCFVGLIILDT